MKSDIEKIITDGTLAPSGENCQPWKFIVEGNKISVFNIPERDLSLYNIGQKGSYVAHGALIENMIISAEYFGYNAKVNVFPDANQSDLMSTITLEKTLPKNELLYPYLEKRCTNRKSHEPAKLTLEEKSKLLNTAKDTGLGELKIVDDKDSMDILGKALAINEQVIFENKKLHDFFYNHVIWRDSDQDKAGGFYYKTLEFLPHQLKGVKMFKNWFILKIMNKLAKVSKMIAKENGEKYSKSGALAIVTVKGWDNIDFVNAGRITERVWLKATQMGLHLHPCTGTIYLMERIKGGDKEIFSEKHLRLIENGYNDIVKTFDVSGQNTPMLFRIGYAQEPTAKSTRMKPSIEFK